MDGIELMATAMHAAKDRLDVSASNLANVSSDGFRKLVARTTLTRTGLMTISVADPSPGPLRHTGRALDLAALDGTLSVREPGGRVREVRSGSFERDDTGRLRDERGRTLLAAGGTPLVAGADATIDARGTLRDGAGRAVGHVRLTAGTTLRSGFVEGANVDAVHEMVDVLDAQRAFETAQKTLSALDEERQKDANDVARVKS
jgi:flagellar basal body rod protein FlgG